MIFILPVAVLAFLAAVLLVPAWLENRTRLASLRLLHDAAAKGPLDPGTVELLLAPPRKRGFENWFALVCLFFGILELSVGIALAIGAVVYGGGLDPTGGAGAGILLGALINGLTGFAQTVLGIVALKLFGRCRQGAPNEGLATWFAQACLFIGVSGTAVGIALALGAQVLGGQLGASGRADAGMMLGALITGFSGLGLTTLGIVALRLFSRDPDA